MNKDLGFVPISRKIINNPLWKQERTYSPFEAWFDLIVSARYDKESELVILPNGKTISINTGELIASERYLQKRWSWSRGKVRNWLDKWEKAHQIARRNVYGETVITLCKYKDYNGYTQSKEPFEKPTKKPTKSPPTVPPTVPNINKVNKVNKENKEDIPPTKNRIETDVDFDVLFKYFNQKCKSLPRMEKITDSRKESVNVISKEYGKKSIEIVLNKVSKSDYLTGKIKDWRASFDWIFEPKNFIKILEGNYDNKDGNKKQKNNGEWLS